MMRVYTARTSSSRNESRPIRSQPKTPASDTLKPMSISAKRR
jgi:hypothetical protein